MRSGQLEEIRASKSLKKAEPQPIPQDWVCTDVMDVDCKNN
jgi:hypothetical protein